ncbi:CD209 antigen-like protein A [Trematomus bernacchii]|uniref:CD209 antigen-like protein A n=1 Tax=Trematomus bernacchii TaxID=40690 RepID=UPI00146D33A5|nr:CD209 antigen-like protein A [Trematomus bernacchii]XP_034003325.1 CD209 antigen-like protein A [Trematomus bernacchii]XP_034003326.1 CD209 antigen-like protein A [Trematomus bernacchii]
MEEVYDDVDDVKTLSSSSSTIQEGPRRLLRASVLGLGLLGVFLLAGLIGLAVHYHNSVGGAAADLSAVKADLSSVTEERDNLTERLQARDQLINQLNVSLTEKTREVECLKKTCPEGWRKFGCSCYLFSTEKASWEQSRQDCRAEGAHLVIVDSEEEQEFITRMIKENTWIGLSDREEEGTWKWVDGSPLNLNLTFWSPGQPDNFDEEDCAEIWSIDHSQSWNDKACKNDQHWICEK